MWDVYYMNIIILYSLCFVILIVLELIYFKIADKFNIIDKPNERSSHSSIVLRGGGVIFPLSTIVWAGLQFILGNCDIVTNYAPFLLGLFLISGVSFIDDIKSLSDNLRLVAQFVAMVLMFYNIGIMQIDMWWTILIGIVICVGAMNVINFMDGINGITAGYSLTVLLPLLILNITLDNSFVDNSFIIVTIISVVIFSMFNFRPKGKAKCFAGDVGSIGIALLMLFMIGMLIVQTQDLTYLIFLIVYGVDGCLTICHRLLLHETLGDAHRKHVYQIMANELNIGHVKVTTLYMTIQLIISLGFISVCPNTIIAHWLYLLASLAILAISYILFKKKYYRLHEEYLFSLRK